MRGGQIFLHALKNGAVLWLPLYQEVSSRCRACRCRAALRADCRYFFWTAQGSRDGQIKTVDRTLQAVFARERRTGRACSPIPPHAGNGDPVERGQHRGRGQYSWGLTGDHSQALPEVEHGVPEAHGGGFGASSWYIFGTREKSACKSSGIRGLDWCWRRGSNPHDQ